MTTRENYELENEYLANEDLEDKDLENESIRPKDTIPEMIEALHIVKGQVNCASGIIDMKDEPYRDASMQPSLKAVARMLEAAIDTLNELYDKIESEGY